MKLTAAIVDLACRNGSFVWTGNRQGIASVATHLKDEPAEPGKVWVSLLPEYKWEQVSLSLITIEHRKDNVDMKGKGADGRVTHLSSKKSSKKQADKANNGNQELDLGTRKIKAIEDAEEARQSASEQISVAQRNYEEAEKAVIAAMHSNGFDPIKRPVYTRPPWGSVTLQQSGEVKEKVKFTAIKKSAKKKAGADASADEDDE